jgi:hypothetical protein
MSPSELTGSAADVLLNSPEMERLLLRLHSCEDVDAFWAASRALLDVLVPSDAALMYVDFADFSRTWIAARIFATPHADKPAGWTQKRRTPDPIPSYILSHPNLPLFRLSDITPDPETLERTKFLGEHRYPDDSLYSACVLFWWRSELHSEIAIRRDASQGDFTPAEMALLARLQPHLSTVLNRLVLPAACWCVGATLAPTLEKRSDSYKAVA